MQAELVIYKNEMQTELKNILHFWMHKMPDMEQGGFRGQVDFNNKVHAQAPKGSVLNARILWTFSAAYRHTGNPVYLQTAERAYQYISRYFIDGECGGVYWTVNAEGIPLDTKKQTYAMAFVVYAFSEYYRCRPSDKVLKEAIDLYQILVEKTYDKQQGGYIEALTKDWKELEDQRLSAKDANEKKSMNTHLHVLEAFTSLYRIWPDVQLKEKLQELIQLFLTHIINSKTTHLQLFFDETWNVKGDVLSYGHDIEAAWLLQEAAAVIMDEDLIKKIKEVSTKLANAAARGLDVDGGLWYEWDNNALHLVKEKHWWPQAEAMVGFFNVYQNTGDEGYLKKSMNSWRFVQRHLLDTEAGEWHWGIKEDYTPMQEDKAGLWKCPYHNGRACIEIINRIDQLNKK